MKPWRPVWKLKDLKAQSIKPDLKFSHEEQEREEPLSELTSDHLKGSAIRRNGGPIATWAILGFIFYRGL